MMIKNQRTLMNTTIKSVYMLKAMYKARLSLIWPASAIFFILHKSTKATIMIKANIPISMMNQRTLKTVPLIKAKIQENNANKPTPAIMPKATIRRGDKLLFVVKARSDMRRKIKAVIPKAIPMISHFTTIVSPENNIPTRTE